MKIKHVEELVGITSKNIRFYEEQGLLTPERADNGYREYHAKDVEILKRIKLLRKLGVSVEEIQRVLLQKSSLSECLENQIVVLQDEQENLKKVQKLAHAIMNAQETIDSIEIDQWLDSVETMEKEGISFVNLKKEDIQMKKKVGAFAGGLITIVFMITYVSILLWVNHLERMPMGFLILFLAIPIVVIISVIVALRSRMKEINGGEEDEAAKY